MGGPWKEGCWLPEPLEETIQLLPSEQSFPSFCHSENTQDNSLTDNNAQVSDKLPKTQCQLLETEESGSTQDNHKTESEQERNENTIVNEAYQETCTSEDVEEKSPLKERHISVDSARDSGIGEGSNFTDVYSMSKNENLRNLWEPKVKHSLADRLPKNMYYLVQPSRYIFPGAEVYYDPDEKYGFSDDDSLSDSDSSDSESDTDNGEKKSDLEKLDKFIGSKQID